MAFRSAKKKKGLGTRGNRSPAVRHVRAHGDPANRTLRIRGVRVCLASRALAAAGSDGGGELVASEAPKAVGV